MELILMEGVSCGGNQTGDTDAVEELLKHGGQVKPLIHCEG